MVRLLIDLRRTIARRELAAVHPAAAGAALLLAAVSATGSLVLGCLPYARTGTRTDVLALVGALWIGGRVVQAALSGEPILRPELFALLPVPRRRL
ncbi:MAG TPA: hypothetical protein VHC23_06300, partial [Jatrophihabitans sp.]|nr:hypothetical protein [Jatrophihabitans sp.]